MGLSWGVTVVRVRPCHRKSSPFPRSRAERGSDPRFSGLCSEGNSGLAPQHAQLFECSGLGSVPGT